MISGITFVIRNGLRWRDAPREYGPHKTIYNRFVRWSRLGVFNKIFAELARKAGKPSRLDALPPAKQLLGDKGYDADWFVKLSPRVASRRASHRSQTARSRSNMIVYSIANGTRSKTCSAGSRTGDASTPVTIDAPIPSCRPSVSPPPYLLALINQS